MSNFPQLGRYQIERLLGQGSYGSVYLAFDPQLQQQVVLKVLRDDLAADANTRQWFSHEAKNLALLSNFAHFEQVNNFFESHQPPFFVMQMVSGQTLEAYLGGRVHSIEDMLPILQQIAVALETAHQHGLLHRDLRASMVLLQQNQSLKVIDFGLVKRTPSAEAMRDMPNAPAQFLFNIAPEQADPNRRSEIGTATDIYALGVIAYQMLTGRLPFEGHHQAILEGHRYHTPTDMRFFNPNLSPAIEEVLKKALSKAPRERYATAGAFVQALETVYASEAERRLRAAVNPIAQTPATSRSYDLRGGSKQSFSDASVYPDNDLMATTRLASSSRGGGTSASSARNSMPLWAIVSLVLLLAIVAGGFYWWLSGEEEAAVSGTATVTTTLSPIDSSMTATPEPEGVTSSPTVIASSTSEIPASGTTATPTVISPTDEASPTVGEAPIETATVGEVPTEVASPTIPQEPTFPPSATLLALPTVLPTLTALQLPTFIPLPTIPGIDIPTIPPLGTIEIPSLP